MLHISNRRWLNGFEHASMTLDASQFLEYIPDLSFFERGFLQLPTMAHLTTTAVVLRKFVQISGCFFFTFLQMLVPHQKYDVGKALVRKDDTHKS